MREPGRHARANFKLGQFPFAERIDIGRIRPLYSASNHVILPFFPRFLATMSHPIGINPGTIVYNQMNQPRELVKAEPITKLFG